jgi:hypothetical protein
MVLACACGDDGGATPDAPAPPMSVMKAMKARGTWMEDFLWAPPAYSQNCTNCEIVTALEFQDDKYQLHVYKRTTAMPATKTEACTATMSFVSMPVTGFTDSQRVKLAVTVGVNTCGFVVGSTSNSTWQVVQSDAQGASFVAGWDGAADSAAAFPGYGYNDTTGKLAYPMKPCATAPATLCEPACKLPNTAGCGYPTP